MRGPRDGPSHFFWAKELVDRYGKRDTGTWIQDSGIVLRLLHDERGDERHQRFIVRTGGGQTLLISHNLDVAARVPLGLGDRVEFRGVFEHNDLGGLVHWTHRDPLGSGEDGFVRFRRQTYA